MISDTFKAMKESGLKRLEAIRSIMRPDLGSHKRTKLARAGCIGSGSLLHNDVAHAHSALLRQDFRDRYEKIRSNRQDHLRFVTILHSVTGLDKDNAVQAASEMESCITGVFCGTGATCLGAIEFEVVNLAMLRRIGSKKDDETRKLDVLERLTDGQLDTGVLIHFHGVVDLSNSILQSDKLRAQLLKVTQWQRSNYQVELKAFYSTRSATKNFDAIAGYLTKGGNETLRYNPGFGRDPEAQLDAQIWRGKSGRADRGADTVTDERSLTNSEILLLDQIWVRQMDQRQDNRGYLVAIS